MAVVGLALVAVGCEVPSLSNDVEVIPYKAPTVGDPNAALSGDLNPATTPPGPLPAKPPAEVLAALLGGVDTLATAEYSATITYFGGDKRGGDLMTMSGRFDKNAGRATVTVTQPSAGLMEIITEGDYAYVRVPMGKQYGDLAGKWVVLPQSAVPELLPSISGFTDPAAFISLLAGIEGELGLVGEEPVEGVPTTRYRAVSSIETAAVTENLNERASAELQRAFDGAGVSHVPIAMEVWVDGAGQPRRLRLEMPLNEAAGAGSSMVLDMMVRKHNEPVQVPATPADALDLTAGV